MARVAGHLSPPLAPQRPPAQPGHVRGRPCFIDEDEPGRIEVELALKPVSRRLSTSGRSCSTA